MNILTGNSMSNIIIGRNLYDVSALKSADSMCDSF